MATLVVAGAKPLVVYAALGILQFIIPRSREADDSHRKIRREKGIDLRNLSEGLLETLCF